MDVLVSKLDSIVIDAEGLEVVAMVASAGWNMAAPYLLLCSIFPDAVRRAKLCAASVAAA